MMVDIKDLQNIDLYALLGVELDVKPNDIKKAYRKKALECHPDKNPDNPKAAELFHQLSKALEILSDVSAKAAYDKILNAKKAAKLRHQQLDSKRQKLKADLEAREKLAADNAKKYKTYESQSPEELLQAEIIRLRKEGSKLLEEEQNYLKQQLNAQKLGGTNIVWNPSEYRIKIKWNASKTDSSNGGYSEENLTRFLQKYGDIEALIMSKKKGRAMVEFKTQSAAEDAVRYEKGLEGNNLQLKWVDKAPGQSVNKISSTLVNERDFESLVLRKLRQEEERKRLIKEMESSDN